MARVAALKVLLLTVLVGSGCNGEDGSPSGNRNAISSSSDSAASPSTQPATQPSPDGAARRLYGTWVAQNVDASMGQVDIRLVFREEGSVKILAWSDLPFVGQVRNKTAPFEIRDHTIHSEAIRGGTSVQYWFTNQGQLVIQYADGKTVTFRRNQAGTHP